MRIGIDVRYLSHGLVGGVHAYVAHFVPALVELADDHQIYLYADTKRPFELQNLPDHVTVRCLSWRNPLSSVYHDFFMRRQMEQDRLDVVHFPANYGFGPSTARTIITLHDQINVLPLRQILRGHRKHPKTIAMMIYLHFCTRMAVARAQFLLTVSDYSRRAIAQYTGFASDRIMLSPNAPSPHVRRIEDPVVLDNVRNRYGLSRHFVLADALKNPAVLVRAWRLLPVEMRETYQIVFFSRHPDPLPVVREVVATGEACLLIRPSQAELLALYSMAEAFVFPSWIEGFGIPILEAMTCGTPVIASDRGAIREVAGGAALLVDAEDEETLARHIKMVLSTPKEAQRLRERGLARAADFTWRGTALRIMECYERAMQDLPVGGRLPVGSPETS